MVIKAYCRVLGNIGQGRTLGRNVDNACNESVSGKWDVNALAGGNFTSKRRCLIVLTLVFAILILELEEN